MGQIRVADYIAQRLADEGVKHVFLVTGGGAMHLNDAFAAETRIAPIFNHHEQACAMAAEGYARITNSFAVVNVTTGPGGLNALNGVFGAYTDSIPMLIISGQVKTETQKLRHPELKLRQLGDQEVDIISVVKPITKHAVELSDPLKVKYELEHALHLLRSGRKGPVWIDVPVDIQGTLIDPDKLPGFRHEPEAVNAKSLKKQVAEMLDALKAAERPTIVVGNGVRLSNSLSAFFKLAETLKIPVCPAWMMDFIASDYHYFGGIQGTIGDRAGNFVVQNSDFVLILGSRMQIRQVSYNWQNFARHAFKVHVDIDRGELNKPTLNTNIKIEADLNDFFEEAQNQLNNYTTPSKHSVWLNWAKERVKKYHPVFVERQRSQGDKINPYHFFHELSKHLTAHHNVVAGNATACVMSFPTLKIHNGQRLFTNAGSASMGYDLPAALGAAIAAPDHTTICLAGDGSIMMNLQELQTVAHYQPNLKIIVINNDGYLSIRSTQAGFFNRVYGASSKTGVSVPDFTKVAAAFGIPSTKLSQPGKITETLKAFLDQSGPALLEVVVDPDQPFEPKLSSRKLPDGKMVSAPLEDMWPFLDRDELRKNMLVPLHPSST